MSKVFKLCFERGGTRMNDNDIIKALEYCCGNIAREDDEECTEDVCYQAELPEERPPNAKPTILDSTGKFAVLMVSS